MKVAIVGGGFCGLLVAYLLEKQNIEATVYEKLENIGGHCKNIYNLNGYSELGTIMLSGSQIKELLIELKLDYSEKFIDHCFINENYNKTEHINRNDTQLIIKELNYLQSILDTHKSSLESVDYTKIHDDLLLSFSDFLSKHNFIALPQLLEPFIASKGYGNMEETPAYYILKAFDINTIYSLIRGDKLLFVDNGISQIIERLSENLSDIRTSLEVISIDINDDQVKVSTKYDESYYDHVIVTTKLPENVIKDEICNQYMKMIDTNHVMISLFKVKNANLSTTFFQSNLGLQNKVQFINVQKNDKETILVAYTYGEASKRIVNDIAHDIEKIGIDIENLNTIKECHTFPHLHLKNINKNFYCDLKSSQINHPIKMIGSLITNPDIESIYISTKNFIKEFLEQ